jgi:hypothetical protein
VETGTKLRVLTMRVRDTRGDGFRRGSGGHELEEVRHRPLLVAVHVRALHLPQPCLKSLVDDKVDDGLGDAVVRRRDALVEATHAKPPVRVADALPHCQAPAASARKQHKRLGHNF